MSELSVRELETTATHYEELLVPALFQSWTNRLLATAEVGPGDKVLDVACGTGILARAAAARVRPRGSVTGLDINPGMLAVAEKIAPEIRWRQGKAESLPFEDRSFDAVISQFGLMFFSDRRAALQEMIRVLAPGGHLAVMVFDALDGIPAYAAYAGLLERLAHQGAAEALRFPFSLGNTDELLALFKDAGMASAASTTHQETARFQNARAMIEGDVKGWFPLAQIALDEDQLEALVTEADTAFKSFIAADGTVAFQLSAHLITWTKA